MGKKATWKSFFQTRNISFRSGHGEKGHVEKFLSNQEYIIQIWTWGKRPRGKVSFKPGIYHSDLDMGKKATWKSFFQTRNISFRSGQREKGHVEKFLSNQEYIIQIWTTGKDEVIKELIEKDYKVIFSNYDAWYFDCGYSSWVGE